MGSLLVVADILPLKDYAKSLRTVAPSFKRAASAAWERRDVIAGFLALALFPILIVAYIVRHGFGEYWRGQQCSMLLSTCPREEQWHHFWQALPYNILLFGGLLGGGIGFVLLFVLIIGFVVPEFMLKPLAWVLRILPGWAKVLNLLLIVVGFHFDLLAS